MHNDISVSNIQVSSKGYLRIKCEKVFVGHELKVWGTNIFWNIPPLVKLLLSIVYS